VNTEEFKAVLYFLYGISIFIPIFCFSQDLSQGAPKRLIFSLAHDTPR